MMGPTFFTKTEKEHCLLSRFAGSWPLWVCLLLPVAMMYVGLMEASGQRVENAVEEA